MNKLPAFAVLHRLLGNADVSIGYVHAEGLHVREALIDIDASHGLALPHFHALEMRPRGKLRRQIGAGQIAGEAEDAAGPSKQMYLHGDTYDLEEWCPGEAVGAARVVFRPTLGRQH
ncbi:hypothetical protein [Lysobacter sp. CA196]|uniref:hypothetical protein n=1 Tax=Lysobacter sp. CA196 TaxID=3455606 RepID=UPI003F8D60FA